MLSVWWRVKQIIQWEILSSGFTMIVGLSCQQLGGVTEKLKEKQDRIYYLNDKVRSHVAKSTREKFLNLGWIPVAHSPYSGDLSPLKFDLFRCLCNHLREKKFNDENDVKIDLINYFGEKSKDLYELGILFLPERWRRVIESDGASITESSFYCSNWKIKIKFLKKTQKPCCQPNSKVEILNHQQTHFLGDLSREELMTLESM